MLTERARIHYHNRLKEVQELELKPYSGHDTVGMVCLDDNHHMVAATSTSGLFMKRPAGLATRRFRIRIYVDSEVGGASATGLGEDLMKGCISYVDRPAHERKGLHPQQACEQAVSRLERDKLKTPPSKSGRPFADCHEQQRRMGRGHQHRRLLVRGRDRTEAPEVYLVKFDENRKQYIEKASEEWMDNYMRTRTAPLERK